MDAMIQRQTQLDHEYTILTTTSRLPKHTLMFTGELTAMLTLHLEMKNTPQALYLLIPDSVSTPGAKIQVFKHNRHSIPDTVSH